MAEDLNTELNQPSESEKRIKQLSGKVKEEAEARVESDRLRAEAETKAAEAEKKAAFAEGFADIVATHPSAKDHRADIQAKVMGGYSVPDATYAVLGPLGKLPAPQAATTEAPPSPVGGSASFTPTTGTKSFADLSQEDRRKALQELSDKGDISF